MAYYDTYMDIDPFDSYNQQFQRISPSLYSRDTPRVSRHDVGTISPQQLSRDTYTDSYPSQYYQAASTRGSRSSSDSRHCSSADSSPIPRYNQPAMMNARSANRYNEPQSYEAGAPAPSIEVVRLPDTKSTARYYCDFEDCKDRYGRRSSVGRKADLKRHMRSVHGKPSINCRYAKCWRRDEDGFCRDDHYREHLRGYHGERR